MIKIKIKQGLENILDAKVIREKVFIQEQGFKNEFDDIDKTAYHIVVYYNNQAVACGRTFLDQDNYEGYILGRIATLKPYRGKKFASKVMLELEQKALESGAKQVKLSAQETVKVFYEKLGYVTTSEIYLDEGCPHITMIKKLK